MTLTLPHSFGMPLQLLNSRTAALLSAMFVPQSERISGQIITPVRLHSEMLRNCSPICCGNTCPSKSGQLVFSGNEKSMLPHSFATLLQLPNSRTAVLLSVMSVPQLEQISGQIITPVQPHSEMLRNCSLICCGSNCLSKSGQLVFFRE